MLKRSLNEKMKDVVFYAIVFFVLYTIIAYLLETKWLSEIISLPKINGILKDSLTITAAFLAPGAAFILFTDWREQHNKQVRNEFGLKVFNQFEKFSKEIDQAGFLYTELECLLPDEAKNKLDPFRLPIGLDHPIVQKNEHLILSFFKQVNLIQDEFNTLIDNFRYFGVVTNQLLPMAPWIKDVLEDFANIHDELNDSYSEYLQLLEIIEDKIILYSKLRSEIEEKLTLNILRQLQEQ
ncbi:hypothetical protein HMPREF0012_01776 [Acinetobacter calcoaceticus RUH2202]|uniref:hypothetical protein n=1 Tax=Acinetobacter calcoaceticus TaxID=471 RepID=UPI0001BB5355|nr:hypothetical protein [Acinetobacter calcoaceticus]EEY78907.1 hypothetical protein HMPREF0012_01776 [Acinetobacter calcoaceticus RUH2202]MDC4869086.1 hypothetical protein [Acinetobacter baumannii]